MSERVWVVIGERWRSSRGWLEPESEYLLPPEEARRAVEQGVAEWGEEKPDFEDVPDGLEIDASG